MNTKRILFQNKNFKLGYYIAAEYRSRFARNKTADKQAILDTLSEYDSDYIHDRVNYYNKLTVTKIYPFAKTIKGYRRPNRSKVYYYDSQEYLRYFAPTLGFEIEPGDVITIPTIATIVKSRPISNDNQNSVQLNLEKIRHFNFIQDDIPFELKKDILIGRGNVSQEHRLRFYQLYFNHPLCDLGDTLKGSKWNKPKISIAEHLAYKFILSLEGNDVATNLKWIMSSNSIAVMPKPKYETWFMEGKLQAGVHYIEVKEDYSDVEDVLTYYINHPNECLAIIQNANEYTYQFLDKKREDLISVMVLQKYFEKTGQNPN